jgi:hypothetical protein
MFGSPPLRHRHRGSCVSLDCLCVPRHRHRRAGDGALLTRLLSGLIDITTIELPICCSVACFPPPTG